MATLHSALKALSPITFSDLPTNQSELESWLSDLFGQSQIILESVPIGEPSTQPIDLSSSTASIASNASEIVASSARHPPPAPEHQALQKEWGKAVKLGAKENKLGMSVYKLSGKDGKGAWFARRSVHEGIAFSQFKKALQMEFPESLAVQGAPGEGNVRGIGGETKVEDVKAANGRVEVYRLSAQFPGPTTPRDFVTMLVTSDKAMNGHSEGGSAPRHHLIVSKPCDHPETQPQSGFIRGFYESVEFIREVPKVATADQSTTDLGEKSASGTPEGTNSVAGEKPSTTASSAQAPHQDEEVLPVEWIMITRSDPGGSVPRFMVERGTPAGICADAEKFLDWACKQDFEEEEASTAKGSQRPKQPLNRESFRTSRVVGVEEEVVKPDEETMNQPSANEKAAVNTQDPGVEQQQTGVMGALAGAAQYLSSYSPLAVLNHSPDTQSNGQTVNPEQSREVVVKPEAEPEDDTTSVASFESADSHLDAEGNKTTSPSSSKLSLPRKSQEHLTSHEKELIKLEQRRMALQTQFTESRTKLEQTANEQTAKDEAAAQKAAERHEKDLQKQKEKYEKELKKIQEKQEKEKKKMEEKARKQADKDEKSKLTRERDEARKELEIVKKEAGLLKKVVEDLQRENTALVAKLGAMTQSDEVLADGSTVTRQRGDTVGSAISSIKRQ